MMRNLLLMILAALLTIQCAANKQKQQEERRLLEVQYKVPVFSSPEIQDFAYETLLYFIGLKKAQEEGNGVSPEITQKKAMEFNEKAAAVKGKMTVEDVRKFTDWSTRLAIEMKKKN